VGCTTIECFAFSGCAALASVTLPSTLQLISDYAFEHCLALTTIAIPEGCQVDNGAFYGSKTRVTHL
jgi:hypothetical protein